MEKLEDGCLKQIVIAGHGNSSKAGPFNLEEIKKKDSGQYKFLELLKKKASKEATIELRACKTCKDNQDLIKAISELTELVVIGYDDTYALKPHGQQWIAKPDGKGNITVEKGEKLTDYKDSWVSGAEEWVNGLLERLNGNKKNKK